MVARNRESHQAPLLARFWGWEASGVLMAPSVLVLALSLATDNFLSAYNL